MLPGRGQFQAGCPSVHCCARTRVRTLSSVLVIILIVGTTRFVHSLDICPPKTSLPLKIPRHMLGGPCSGLPQAEAPQSDETHPFNRAFSSYSPLTRSPAHQFLQTRSRNPTLPHHAPISSCAHSPATSVILEFRHRMFCTVATSTYPQSQEPIDDRASQAA